jgi:hypothetical protein
MAKPFGSQVDFQKIPALRFVVESSATGSPPSSPLDGQFWFDTTISRLYIRESGAWVLVSNAGTVGTTDSAGGDLSGTFSNLQIVANAVGATEIANSAVTYSKIQNVSTNNKLLGRSTAGAGVVEEISLGSDLAMSGGALQTAALTGDVTKAAGGTATTITTNSVTYAKMQDVSATDRLIGRDTAGSGDPEELTVTGGLEFTGSGGIQRSALTGDVTAPAGSNATTIAANAVTVAKLATAVTLAAIAAANASAGPITASGQKITNLADGTAATDAVTKQQLDGVSSGLDIKASVRAASTANVTLTYNATGGTAGRGQITAAPNTLDGVTLAVGNRILLKNQATGAQNGIWVVTTLGTGSTGVWDRATDFDTDSEVTAGAFTFVEEGTSNGDTGWVLTTNNPITIGGASGTSLAFTQFSGGGAVVAGNGLTLTGNVLDVVGTTNRITVAADSIDIAATYVGQTSITTLGTITTGTWGGTAIAVANGGTGATSASGARTNLGATGKYSATLGALSAGVESTITHNLGSTEVIAAFRDATTDHVIDFDWRPLSVNTIGVTADVAYGASAVKVVVIG